MSVVLKAENVAIRYITGDFKDIGLKEYAMRRLTGNYQVKEFRAVDGVSFELYDGDMLGIVGANGAGKSTLLKAVAGIMEPTQGKIIANGDVAALLELGSGFDGDLTVKENAYLRGAMLGYTKDFMDSTYEQIIDFAELKEFENRPFKQLSSGMKSRLAFSIASMVQPDILILDEVLSVGDGAFQKKSAKKMREIISQGATTILVSHSLSQIRELCNKVLWLDHGRQVAFGDSGEICDRYEAFLRGECSAEMPNCEQKVLNEYKKAETDNKLDKSYWGGDDQPKKIYKYMQSSVYIMAAVLCAMLCRCFMQDSNVYITALNSCNGQSQGTEIWIENVIIDGESYAPQEVLSGNWLYEGGYYKWRSYEQPEYLSNRLSIPFVKGQDVSIVLDANKYRGIVEIRMPFFSHTIDCYSDDNNSITYNLKADLSDLRIPGKLLFLSVLALLFFAAAVSNLVFYDRENIQLTKSREIWLDLLKVICSFLIVELHTVGRIYTTYELGNSNWFVALILNTIPRCAVPIFIMITGILLLDKDISMKKALHKVQKAVCWLIVWNVLYILLQQVLWGSTDGVFNSVVSMPVKRGPSGHLWYAYLLVWIYAFAPIFNVMYKALNNKMKAYFIAITLIVPGLLDLYLKCFNFSSPEIVHSTILYMSFQYMGLMFLGRFIYDCFDKIRNAAYVSFVTTIVGFCSSVILTWGFSWYHKQALDVFLMETRLPIIIYSIGLFGIFCIYKAKIAALPVFMKSFIVKLSQISLGVYFFHCVVIWTVEDIPSLHLIRSGSILSVLGCCIIYYLLSLLCVNIMSKIPLLEKFVKA